MIDTKRLLQNEQDLASEIGEIADRLMKVNRQQHEIISDIQQTLINFLVVQQNIIDGFNEEGKKIS